MHHSLQNFGDLMQPYLVDTSILCFSPTNWLDRSLGTFMKIMPKLYTTATTFWFPLIYHFHRMIQVSRSTSIAPGKLKSSPTSTHTLANFNFVILHSKLAIPRGMSNKLALYPVPTIVYNYLGNSKLI